MQSTDETETPAPWWRVVLIGRNPAFTAIRLLVTVALVLFFYQVAVRRIVVQKVSMEPTYREGQKLWVNRLAYRFGEPLRGDVVAVFSTGENLLLLKRIVGLPGERCNILGGLVFIDGEELEEPYIKRPRARWIYPEIKLGPDEFLVIGDNREMPMKDHEFGRVKRDRILGRIVR